MIIRGDVFLVVHGDPAVYQAQLQQCTPQHKHETEEDQDSDQDRAPGIHLRKALQMVLPLAGSFAPGKPPAGHNDHHLLLQECGNPQHHAGHTKKTANL